MRFRDDAKLDTSQVEDRRRRPSPPHVDGGRTYGRPTPEQRLFEVARRMTPGTVGGLVRSAAPVQRPMADVYIHRHAKSGGQATMLVAASNAMDTTKERADYVCDGTNDEAEIQAALDAVFAVASGRVWLSEGSFALASAVTVSGFGTLTGLGKGVTFLNCAAGGVIANSDSNVLADMTILGGGTGLGIDINGRYTLLRDLDIETFATGVDISANRGVKVRHCQIETCDHGIDIAALSTGEHSILANSLVSCGRGIYSAAGLTEIIGNHLEGNWNTDDGISVVGGTLPSVIADNLVSAHDIGIVSSNEGNVVTGNLIYFPGQHGIYTNADDTAITSNVILGASQQTTNTYDSIHVDSPAERVMVQANKCSPSGETRYGIRVQSGAIDTFATNNDLKGDGTWGTAAFSDAGTGTITTAGNRT